MLNNKKIIFIVFISLLFTLALNNATQAQSTNKAMGCCKTIGKDGFLNQEVEKIRDTTEEDCKDTEWDRKVSWQEGYKAVGLYCEKITNSKPAETGEKIIFSPKVSVPESKFISGEKFEISDNSSLLADYIVAIFKYSIGIIGIIAAIVLMFAGARWLTAGGNQNTISEAKTYIASSLSGLILVLGAFLILSNINDDLINLKIPAVQRIKYISMDVGCCRKTTASGEVTAQGQIGREECEKMKKDFADVSFFEGYIAYTYPDSWHAFDLAGKQDCVPKVGCCAVDMNKFQTFFMEWPWDKWACVENLEKDECDKMQTSAWWNVMPVIYSVWKEDIDTEWFWGQKCVKVKDCEGEEIFKNVSSFKASVKKQKLKEN